MNPNSTAVTSMVFRSHLSGMHVHTVSTQRDLFSRYNESNDRTSHSTRLSNNKRLLTEIAHTNNFKFFFEGHQFVGE